MPRKHKLCVKGEMSLNQCGEFSVTESEQTREYFFIQLAQEVRCFENQCPHTGATLNWNPNVFLDKEQKYIQCSLHGALFEKESGKCLFGPCLGQSLKSVETQLVDDTWCAILSE